MIWNNRDDAHAFLQERHRVIKELASFEEPIMEDTLQNNTLPELCMSPFLPRLSEQNEPLSIVQQVNEEAFSLLTYIKTNAILVTEKQPSLVTCNDAQNRENKRAVRFANTAKRKVLEIKSHCDAFNAETYDMSTYERLMRDYKSYIDGIDADYYYCEPTIGQVLQAIESSRASRDAAFASVQHAADIIYGNAHRELKKLGKKLQKVLGARRRFESLSSGGRGTKEITSSHRRFQRQQERVSRFKLASIPDSSHKPGSIFDEMKRMISEEREASVITELDRLRNEYVDKKIPVPKPAEFTQSKSSSKFQFDQLNMGSYGWAVLTDVLLRNIDSIASDMESEKYPVKLNSVYRNPSHPLSSGRSQHQYGTAVDIQVFDFDKSDAKRVRDEEDWKLLRTVTDMYSPSYTEPLSQSGPGHVHVDWRGKGTTGHTYIQGDELV